MELTLEMPEDVFSSLRVAPAEFGAALRLAACVKWYELGKLSQAKAAEISGISRAAFIDALHAHRVPAIQLDPDQLDRELAQ
jgi:predicted HTH domain antitoxin